MTINNIKVYANPGGPSQCPTKVVANDDTAIAPSGENTTIFILQNDILPGQGGFTVTIIVSPKNGNVTVNPNGSITYVSNSGYCGTDSLTYQLRQGNDCAQAKVRITVRCYPPYAIKQINKVNASGIADSLGVYCQLTGTVYGVNLRGTTGLQFFMIDDEHNGITAFSTTRNFGYTVREGDRITVRGVSASSTVYCKFYPIQFFAYQQINRSYLPLKSINPAKAQKINLSASENFAT